MSAPLRVSVVIPIHNEEEILPELLKRLIFALDSVTDSTYELVFVDDGSSDKSLQILENAHETLPSISLISLSRNFGHQAAVSAGYDFVSGDVVVTMDGDLQDPPELIPTLIARYREGFDVVYVIRATRQHNPLLKICYWAFYRLVWALATISIPIDSGDFGLVSKRVADALQSLPEYHRFHRGLRAWVGYRQVGVPLDRPARLAGKSKYTTKRLLGLAFDGLLSFSLSPLRFVSILGGVTIAFSGSFVAYSVFMKAFYDSSPTGFTALVVAVVFTSGVQLLSLGIIGEYVGRIFEQSKGRPRYIVQKVVRSNFHAS